MISLSFKFDIRNAQGRNAKFVTVNLVLTQEQVVNLFTLRQISRDQELAFAEVYFQGIHWTNTSLLLESGEFVVSVEEGVAINAYLSPSEDSILRSQWLSWTDLEESNATWEADCAVV